ncbi:MAG TPA: bifunctional diaminohydroxyphosphoribosylaminopyrimidine deaminase/5-amino-6-(5-phosphoribosylamino)uracil reductase RibD [Verrucomicrobiae bacterium]|jgi:diaminohydroxyphosphoribosylaminopyrimidine deaminase/5-amino-6-(5-phosphoribosylamino)uracil reductase|nr:bifunctional diaminohydroxyphosphoribosylaminopyrimidine deaminase/5-amino-6-(5-phosphoribosylamino)uracil reductase RibD [Verrucomicrobiae bacterium]
MSDTKFMRIALNLAKRGFGAVSPNPVVGAVLVKGGKIIGRGWHRRAGLPHAEIEALRDVQKRGHSPRNATLYVTLEPCCTHGRTPPCTDAIISAGIKKVVVGAIDPNPKHTGKSFQILKRAGIEVDWWGKRPREPLLLFGKPGSRGRSPHRKIADECVNLNEAFNHWIVQRTPFVTVKAAVTLDGKIATASGESKWVTGEKSRADGMKLRQGSDGILVGINTILADNPSLTFRPVQSPKSKVQSRKKLRRIILDSMARTPPNAEVVSDEFTALTTIIASKSAPENRVTALAKKTNVIFAPLVNSKLDLKWLLEKLGSENVTSLLIEGGGEVNASFLLGGFANRVVFFYAPKILGGRDSRKAVAGEGVKNLADAIQLREMEWKEVGEDLLLTARVG